MIIYWIFLVLILWPVPSASLICYNCDCPPSNTSACNCTDTINAEEGAHCIIIENLNPSNSYVELSATFLNSSYVRIKDAYYIVVDETIFYNETTTEWQTKTNRIVYGCDWDYCNSDTLISSLPDTFNLTINSTWLNKNIHGNGSVNSCHNCSDQTCGNETYSINDELCPYASCDNATTCSLRNLWHNTETNELCYRSECTPSQSADEEDEKYKVQIEAIVYLAQNRSNFQIWELNINCAADNCSRSTIFQEIRDEIQGEVDDLTAFPTNRLTTPAPTTSTALTITSTAPTMTSTASTMTATASTITSTAPTMTSTASTMTSTASTITSTASTASATTSTASTTASTITSTASSTTTSTTTSTASTTASTTTSTATAIPTTTTIPANPLYCYNCTCTGVTCPCTTSEVVSADNAYCTITRRHIGQDIYIDYGYLYINAPNFHFSEYPYVFVRESIIYDETLGRWNTDPEYVVYGCNSTLCNKPDLVTYLPASFQMRLSESWLNSSILGSGLPIRDCHECENGTVCSENDFIDVSQCPIEQCNTTCLVADRFSSSGNNEQCYDSHCAPEDDSDVVLDKHRVDIEGVLYASNPGNVEVREIEIYCRADDCSRPEIFKELRGNLTLDAGDLTFLFNQTVDVPKIRCFDCYCSSDQNCTCNTVSTANADSNYCSIVRNYDGTNVNVYFQHLDISSAYKNIRELPFVLIEESILYDNQTGAWFTRTNRVLYGCNWDYCNKLSLLSLLPSNSIIYLPDSWLNSSILGTGQPVHQCHECTDSICSIDNTFNSSLCDIQPCNTTCLVSNTYVNLTTNEQCYQSYCVPQDSDEITYDTHRVEITGVVYPSQPNTLDIWEIYAYCRVDNCSRPEIFEEIKQNLTIDTGNISTLFSQTNIGEPGQLSCYACYCVDDPVCACNNIVVESTGDTYCTIIREYNGQHVWIYYEHIDRNSSRAYIRDFPYILVEETILYNDDTGRWTTRPTLIVYGCNWDYCNDPSLIPYLPISFQMRLPETWLNSSVLGNEAPVRSCHECRDAPQCGTTDYLDASRCPPRDCNTTCFVADTFDDPLSNEYCYQSYCLDEISDEEDVNHHRIEIQGIVYGNIPNAELELWEVDIYCRADDCSRLEIFQELLAQLTADLGDLSKFNITAAVRTTTTTTTTTTTPAPPTITCFDCYCYSDPNCPCNTTSTADSTLNYCTIIRQNYNDESFFIALEHIERNSTRVFIREFPFLLVEESIIYSNITGRWNTITNLVIYGCNWDLCNHPSYVPYIPNSFQMSISETWLNTNVLGSGQPVRNCHECPDLSICSTTDFIDGALCPIQQCNTTCLVSDLYSDPDTNEQCYQSYCAPPDSIFFQIDPHRVEMEGILYLEPKGRPVELWEVDIFCRADDCSRPTIFDEIKNQFTVITGDLNIFYNITPISTTSRSTTLSSSSASSSNPTTTSGSTIAPGSTTTAASTSESIYMTHIILVVFFLVISLMNSY